MPETLWGHIDPADMMAYGFSPVPSCGIGQNLYVEPDGTAYPCYAWHGENWRLGSIEGEGGLRRVINSNAFRALGTHTVNTNRACRECPLRYLCGGLCRAWDRPGDADTTLADCAPLHLRAHDLLLAALEALEVPPERWLAAGLSPPEDSPRYERIALTRTEEELTNNGAF